LSWPGGSSRGRSASPEGPAVYACEKALSASGSTLCRRTATVTVIKPLVQSLLPLIALLLVGCIPLALPASSSATDTPIVALPDLAIKSIYLEMAGRQGSRCVLTFSPYGVRVVVQNVGVTASGQFEVELNEAIQTVNAGLDAGQDIELHFPGTIPSGQYTARVDPANLVPEEHEGNNAATFTAPTPTPPPPCTPTPG